MFVVKKRQLMLLIITVVSVAASVGCTRSRAVELVDPAESNEEATKPWPKARIHQSVVYDPVLEQVLMFGGFSKLQ